MVAFNLIDRLTSAIISISSIGTTLLMNFRSDINGVRVIAVIPVLLFTQVISKNASFTA